MHFSRIDKKEELLKDKKSDLFNMQAFSLPIPKSEETLNGLVCRPSAGHTSYYYDEQMPKDQIVLHHTAGHLQGDLSTLTTDNFHVSVAFVIARDGTIYQLFNSNRWSYHLGPKALGGNKPGSKRSIGIELSNYGYLDKKGTDLETPYSKEQRKKGRAPDIYCSEAEKELYTKLEIPYRDKQYYATFSDEQYRALVKLLRYLCATYNIPAAFLSDQDRYNHTMKVVGFKGIVSHVNYRKDKWDLGLAFDWQRVMNEMKTDRHGIDELYKRLEKAEIDYVTAADIFRTAQLKVWSPEGQTAKAEQELVNAKNAVMEAHSTRADIQKKIAEAEAAQPVGERSLETVFTSEEEIDAAFPFVATRGLEDHGEDGPEERDLSEFYL